MFHYSTYQRFKLPIFRSIELQNCISHWHQRIASIHTDKQLIFVLLFFKVLCDKMMSLRMYIYVYLCSFSNTCIKGKQIQTGFVTFITRSFLFYTQRHKYNTVNAITSITTISDIIYPFDVEVPSHLSLPSRMIRILEK